MASYYDERKKKYIVNSPQEGTSKEFPEKPGMMDYFKEGFESNDTKAQLEALRRKRQSKSE